MLRLVYAMLPVNAMLMVLAIGWPSRSAAQPFPSQAGSNVEYQYQLHYPRPWLGYPGPGLSLGGSLPEQGRDGISSLYGLPFPYPLGAGVYPHPPLASRHSAVGPSWYGPDPGVFPAQFTPDPIPLSAKRPTIPTTSVVQAARTQRARRAVVPLAAKVEPVRPSSAAATQQSLEQQALGDERLRDQQWSQACLNYRQAVDLADDRAEAHFRLGFAYTAMKHFTLALRQFKRGLVLDPSLAHSGDSLGAIFGPDSQLARASIQHQIAIWVREDLHDPDRLFLLGLWLHYDEDSRGHELLEAALRIAGDGDHLIALLTPPIEPAGEDEPEAVAAGLELPKLHALPVAIGETHDFSDSSDSSDSSSTSDSLPPAPLPSQEVFP